MIIPSFYYNNLLFLPLLYYGQELLTLDNRVSTTRAFWQRNKKGSYAEVDFVFPYKGMLIPIEVKSGHNAKLRSLHIFMDDAPHDIAVRVWNQPLSIDEVKTLKGKIFKLINLPFYYVGQLPKVLGLVLSNKRFEFKQNNFTSNKTFVR